MLQKLNSSPKASRNTALGQTDPPPHAFYVLLISLKNKPKFKTAETGQYNREPIPNLLWRIINFHLLYYNDYLNGCQTDGITSSYLLTAYAQNWWLPKNLNGSILISHTDTLHKCLHLLLSTCSNLYLLLLLLTSSFTKLII